MATITTMLLMVRCGVVAGLLLLVLGCTAAGKDFQGKDQQKAVDAHLAAAAAYLHKKDSMRARKHATRALEVDSMSAAAHGTMALIFRYELDPENEELHYRRALRLDPSFSVARNNYAALLFGQQRYKDAVRHLKKAVSDTGYEQRAQAYENLGRAYVQLSKQEPAFDAFQRALRLNDNMRHAHLELGYIYFERGNFDKALDYLRGFHTRSRQTPRSLWLGIQLERKLGDLDALASYELALRTMFSESSEYQQWQLGGSND